MRTSSKRLMAATIFAKAGGIGRNCFGHVLRLCGHDSQIASCGSHSAGMRKPSAAGVAAGVDEAERELALRTGTRKKGSRGG